MRTNTQASIDALHRQIAALVAAEKAHYDAAHAAEAPVCRQIAHTRIEMASRCPSDRALMVWATASLPPMRYLKEAA